MPAKGTNVENGAGKSTRRIIKRYSNRKLYDARDSKYVTLLQIAEMVRNGEDVQIIDNTTKEDKTDVTIAAAISEELRSKPHSVFLGTWRGLIQERGERLLHSLREGPIGRLIPTPSSAETRDAGIKSEERESGAVPPAGAGRALSGSGDQPASGKHDTRLTLAELVASSRSTLDQWQHAIDERIRAMLPSSALLADLRGEVEKLKVRIGALENAVSALKRDASVEPADRANTQQGDDPGRVGG